MSRFIIIRTTGMFCKCFNLYYMRLQKEILALSKKILVLKILNLSTFSHNYNK